MLAYTLLGIDVNPSTGECAFLILDPHYSGAPTLHVHASAGTDLVCVLCYCQCSCLSYSRSGSRASRRYTSWQDEMHLGLSLFKLSVAGPDDIKKIHKGHWVAWKRADGKAAAGGPLFVQNAFYNLLCPQRPRCL